MANGDKNTRVFHAQATKRRKKNEIRSLVGKDGEMKTEEEEKANIIRDYFMELFGSGEPRSEDVTKVVDAIHTHLSSEDIEFLERPFDANEVREALFGMHLTKAPGPDGFNARFFQKIWPEIGDEITREVLAVLNEGKTIQEWNDTLICIIPKKNEAKSVADFRPLSLCNTIYKMVSKTIANRLRVVMEHLIDPAQSAFIKGRLITDNILVSFECQHWLRKKKKEKDGYAVMKIDMSKAYDRVEWNFLEDVMVKMGFPKEFYEVVMRCVRSVRFSFLLNQSVYGEEVPSRGIRQGDPLLPFLFVLCAQGLSSLIRKAETEGEMTGFPLVPNQIIISHLFFADDSVIFLKAGEKGAKAMLEVLRMYEMASGQAINRDKSTISFSPNVKEEDAARFKRIVGIRDERGFQTYLGLPTFCTR